MKCMMLTVLSMMLLVSVAYPQESQESTGTFVDPRDGNTYKWVKIGNQIWMAENLRFETDDGSWCWDNKDDKCEELGRFYNWTTAMRVAPPGWHIPSDDEWKEMEMALGLTKEQVDQEGSRVDSARAVAGKIKLVGGWPEEYEGQPLSVTDEVGFSAVQTGFYARGEFTHQGYSSWWTSNESGQSAWIRHIGFFDNFVTRVLNKKEFAFSVRCVKDTVEPDDSSGD